MAVLRAELSQVTDSAVLPTAVCQKQQLWAVTQMILIPYPAFISNQVLDWLVKPCLLLLPQSPRPPPSLCLHPSPNQ